MQITKQKLQTYEILVALYVMTLIISNIASVKLVGLSGFVFDAGTILFPLAYILSDIVTEIYGFRRMRRLLLVSIGMLVFAIATLTFVGLLPSAVDWSGQSAYEQTLGVTWRIVTASVIAIFFGELINAYVLARMKIRSGGKQLWSRLIGSSAVGNLVDTTIFTVIAFAGTVSSATLITVIITVYGIKMLTEIVLSPVTMQIISAIKRRDESDVYEDPKLF